MKIIFTFLRNIRARSHYSYSQHFKNLKRSDGLDFDKFSDDLLFSSFSDESSDLSDEEIG